MNETLPQALLAEIRRVRDVLRPRYQALDGQPGVNVQPVLALMQIELDAAEGALADGDPADMLLMLRTLRGYES